MFTHCHKTMPVCTSKYTIPVKLINTGFWKEKANLRCTFNICTIYLYIQRKMRVSTKQYYMYNTTAIVSVSGNYFYYRNTNVSETEKVCRIGKTYCNASMPIKYMSSLNNVIHWPNRVNFRHLKGKLLTCFFSLVKFRYVYSCIIFSCNDSRKKLVSPGSWEWLVLHWWMSEICFEVCTFRITLYKISIE